MKGALAFCVSALFSLSSLAADIIPRVYRETETEESAMEESRLEFMQYSSINLYWTFKGHGRPTALNTNDVPLFSFSKTNAWTQTCTGTVDNAVQGRVRFPLSPGMLNTNGSYPFVVTVSDQNGTTILSRTRGDLVLWPRISPSTNLFPVPPSGVDLSLYTFYNIPWVGYSDTSYLLTSNRALYATNWIASNRDMLQIITQNWFWATNTIVEIHGDVVSVSNSWYGSIAYTISGTDLVRWDKAGTDAILATNFMGTNTIYRDSTNAAVIDATNRVAGVGYLLSETDKLWEIWYPTPATLFVASITAAFVESR